MQSDTTTARAQAALIARRQSRPLRCAASAFAVWARDGATPAQAARVAIAAFRAHWTMPDRCRAALAALRRTRDLPELL